jgi:hypothetical protein
MVNWTLAKNVTECTSTTEHLAADCHWTPSGNLEKGNKEKSLATDEALKG